MRNYCNSLIGFIPISMIYGSDNLHSQNPRLPSVNPSKTSRVAAWQNNLTCECGAALTVPLATVAKFNITGNGGLDFYSVSATHGYNLVMLVVPQGDYKGNYVASACVDDLNGGCPSEASSGCTAACFAFGDPKNCCNGENAGPGICKPSQYSLYFRSRCPWVYSYVYDEDDEKEKSRAFACSLADYLIPILFWPSVTQRIDVRRRMRRLVCASQAIIRCISKVGVLTLTVMCMMMGKRRKDLRLLLG
ncbi:hypothetical protein RJ640_022163 [Escallonia rubra]|uniref:Thaumatin-like protein n=1 Tax=Escallonia rubra TaxID=112253 RepID=A0AA88UF11_9ASTE|nr:hypothetical protein RJ640_022163 [Escallonia rubra]